MEQFADRVKNLLLEVKGVDISTLDYMEMPLGKNKYNLLKTTGNVNLIAGKFKTKQDADIIINNFLNMQLP